ncbi:MAG TPA: SET domain-containing protein [Rudaea sp.]
MRIDPAPAYVKDTGTARGRGVFAARAIKAGEIVETCPVVVVNKYVSDLPPEIGCIVYGWSYLTTRQVGTLSAIALGYGSLYNHDNPANMRYVADGALQVLRYIAVRDIAPNEELTVNYNAHGGGAEWNEDKWFEDKQITPIVQGGGSGGT